MAERFKKPKPLALCRVCGAYTDRRRDVNHRCSKTRYGRRCPGTFKSDLGQVWNECQVCYGKGKVGSETCVECAGWGWTLLA